MKKKVLSLILAITSSMMLSGCNVVAEEIGSMLGKAAAASMESEDKESKESKTKESETSESEEKESETKETEGKESESKEDADHETLEGLSDDLWSYQVAINEDVYQFPMWYSDFEEKGWSFKEDSSEMLSSDDFLYCWWERDGISVMTIIVNMSSNAKPIAESAVVGIEIDYNDAMKEKGYKIVMPGGIVLGEALKGDIIEAYGEPNNKQENDLYHCYGYTEDWYEKITFFWNTKTDVICSVKMENRIELEGTDHSVSAEVPDVVTAYTAPTAVGEDLYSFDIKINGNYYTLPAPVSAFVDNGYELYDHTAGDKELAAGDFGYVTMKYNGVGYKYGAKNYADYATTIENCFIYSFDVSDHEDIELEIPLGIKCGDTEEELLSKLEGYQYKKYDVGKVGADYVVKTRNDYISGYEFEVDSGIITKIIIESW